ncbi:MAG TPA: hypothetical protein VFK05_29970 [Polyangiaceae bacterium]|nr:hypothetical protein [Polyangiaceae bacterium]
MHRSHRSLVFTAACWCLIGATAVGCKKEEPQRNAAPAPSNAAPSAAPGAAPAQAKEQAGTTPIADCPAGEYLFDYSTYNLQALLDPTGRGVMKVLNQAGKAKCTLSSPSAGTWSCSVTEPMVAEVAMGQAGLAASGKIEQTGTAVLTYVSDAPGSLQVKSTDLSQYKLKATMKLAGKEIPMPMDKLPRLFGNDGTRWHYACTAESLHLKGDVPGNATVELTMKRL